MISIGWSWGSLLSNCSLRHLLAAAGQCKCKERSFRERKKGYRNRSSRTRNRHKILISIWYIVDPFPADDICRAGTIYLLERYFPGYRNHQTFVKWLVSSRNGVIYVDKKISLLILEERKWDGNNLNKLLVYSPSSRLETSNVDGVSSVCRELLTRSSRGVSLLFWQLGNTHVVPL